MGILYQNRGFQAEEHELEDSLSVLTLCDLPAEVQRKYRRYQQIFF
jgi:hypothetical protein